MTRNVTTLPTIGSLAELPSVHNPPCLSHYQPTHRRHAENRLDPIRFDNPVKNLETSLRQEYLAVETPLLLEPFEAVAGWVATLPIEVDGRIAGRLDGLMGWIEAADLNHPQVDDCSTIWAGEPWSFQPSRYRCRRD